ncbi:protein kinase [Planctomycetota bacterium]
MATDLDKYEEIFSRAKEISDPQERAAYLDSVCKSDGLRAEVGKLLALEEDAADFLEIPALEPRVMLNATVPQEGPGSIIGRYQLLERIGEGGMAVVYLAAQQHPIRRQVALKLIKLGMDSEQVIARFEAERQALAMMDHPNIAKVFDAGSTDTGRPFFVMEWVKGSSITQFCDTQQLNTKQRLELFASVCEGVHHAHQKGIIHRDIKPSNILVCLHDGRPVPKVIDFGIAKAICQRLTEKTLFTHYAQIVGTPEYMSPEQAELNEMDIDIRTDVYSLGVLLYELLVGTPPFTSDYLRKKAYSEIQRILREEDPLKPSTKISTLGQASRDIAKQRGTSPENLGRQIRSDLDWIAMKALEKDRTRRYDSVSGLATDIYRHLQCEPVSAGPPSTRYRLKKLVQRNRTRLATVGAVLITALIGLVAAGYLHGRIRLATHQVDVVTNQAEIDRHRAEAQRLYTQGSYQAALTELEPLLQDERVDPRVQLLASQILFDLDRIQEAESQLESLLSAESQVAGIAHYLFSRIRSQSDPTQAQVHRDEANRLLPETTEAQVLRALATANPDEAMAWLDQALEASPSDYPAREARAMLYYGVHDYIKMQRDAEVMISMRPQDYLGYALRALARREQGELTQALVDHTRALSLCNVQRDMPRLYNQRQETHWRMGNAEAARQDIQHCIKLAPQDRVYQATLARILFKLGEFEQAKAVYEQLYWQEHNWLAGMSKWIGDTICAGDSWELPEDNLESWSAIFIYPPSLILPTMAELYQTLTTQGVRLIQGSRNTSSWSPDGKQLAYTRVETYRWDDTTLANVLTHQARAEHGIEVLDLASGQARVLSTIGGNPVWSPDGRTIAYVRNFDVYDGHQEIYLVPAGGGESVRLGEGSSPCWTTCDPTRLYYYVPDDKALCYTDVEDPTRSSVRVGTYSGFHFQISPDARHLAFITGNALTVREMSSGKDILRWVVPGTRFGSRLHWSPDSQEISLGYAASVFWPSGLWIYNLKQGQGRHVLEPMAVHCNWSPDRSQLALNLVYPMSEIWLVPRDPNLPTWAALGQGQTRGEYLRSHWHQYVQFSRQRGESCQRFMANTMCAVGINQYEGGEYDEALWTLQQVAELPWAQIAAFGLENSAYRAMSLWKLGRTAEAYEQLQQARTIYKQSTLQQAKVLYQAEAFFSLPEGPLQAAWKSLMEGKLDRALGSIQAIIDGNAIQDSATCESAVSLRSALAREYNHLARAARHENRDLRHEITCYQAALRADPNDVPALSDLALLLASSTDPAIRVGKKAFQYARRVCELTQYRDVAALRSLAAACAANDDFNEAIRWQQAAIDALPEGCTSQELSARLSMYQLEEPPWAHQVDALIGWWPMTAADDKQLKDASGNEHHGRLLGDAHVMMDPDRGAVLHLDGEGDWVDCGHIPDFNPGEALTVAAWIRVDRFSRRRQMLISNGNWEINRELSRRVLKFGCRSLSSPDIFRLNNDTDLKTPVDDNRWHHVMGVYDGTRIYQYVDGQLDRSVCVAGSLVPSELPLCIGARSPGSRSNERRFEWEGLIDDIRIYNRALSQDEVKTLFEDGGL